MLEIMFSYVGTSKISMLFFMLNIYIFFGSCFIQCLLFFIVELLYSDSMDKKVFW